MRSGFSAVTNLLTPQQLTEDRGMMRRTPLFQELLFVMVNSPNPHEYGKDQRFKYRFGVFDEVSRTY